MTFGDSLYYIHVYLYTSIFVYSIRKKTLFLFLYTNHLLENVGDSIICLLAESSLRVRSYKRFLLQTIQRLDKVLSILLLYFLAFILVTEQTTSLRLTVLFIG
jgi:hypothetical protein